MGNCSWGAVGFFCRIVCVCGWYIFMFWFFVWKMYASVNNEGREPSIFCDQHLCIVQFLCRRSNRWIEISSRKRRCKRLKLAFLFPLFKQTRIEYEHVIGKVPAVPPGHPFPLQHPSNWSWFVLRSHWVLVSPWSVCSVPRRFVSKDFNCWWVLFALHCEV